MALEAARAVQRSSVRMRQGRVGPGVQALQRGGTAYELRLLCRGTPAQYCVQIFSVLASARIAASAVSPCFFFASVLSLICGECEHPFTQLMRQAIITSSALTLAAVG